MNPAAERHADDLVSAHLDGELDAETSAWVEEHLAVCPACSEAAEAAAAARSWIRSSPTVDASPVVERVIAHRHRLVGTGLAFVGAAGVVLAALALTAAVAHPRVVPDLDAMVATHRTSSHDQMDGVRVVDHAGTPYATPAGMQDEHARLSRLAVYDGRDLTTVLYAAETDAALVSVYQQPGRLDWDELPAGEIDDVHGRQVWTRNSAPVVAVTEVGDLVVTVVSDDAGAARTVVRGLPASERSSTLDRLHDSCQRLVQVFALGG